MEKRVLLVFLLVLLLSTLFVTAANETNIDTKAYSCLENKVNDKCSSLSAEERVFSLLAIGKCKDEVVSDLGNHFNSNTKLTAQAILALGKIGSSTDTAEDWLISQNKTPENMDWLLQIESNNATECTVSYGGSSYDVSVNEDKTLGSNAGSCLGIYEDYWLKIAPNCYNQEFTISCDKSFLTTLLYKKTTSGVIYVSGNTHSASGGGSTTEKVNSFCFKQGNSCNYESSLWAALVLDYMGYDVSSYLPYLVTMADEAGNKQYLPESFLYSLTNNFRNELLLQQLPEGSWKVSDDKFYDTALALLPFQSETLAEKTNTINWLGEVQGADGCWQGVRDTAFILYSIWPRIISEVEGAGCEESGGYCMSQISCSDSGGDILNEYTDCFGTNICCSKEKVLGSCSEQGGEICSSGEECSVSTVEASDTSECCLGTCNEISTEVSECETQGGSCKISCSSKETTSAYTCTSYSDVCCIAKKTSYVWLIILLMILIALTILGIIYRKQLRDFLFKLKSKIGKGKGKPSAGGPGPRRFPPSSRVYPGAVPRRILPPQTRPPATKQPAKKSEFDEVLKKLKEIGK